jgi:hypothetical protein
MKSNIYRKIAKAAESALSANELPPFRGGD